MSARLLALDCSTEALAVAACDGERQWTRTTAGGALASSRIIALALEALADCAVPVAQLDAVAFGAGPGAFTGLRCACAVAQGLAFALGKPVLAIDSLMIVAEASRARLPRGLRELWVAMDARMHEAYAAQYLLAQDGHWQVTSAPALLEKRFPPPPVGPPGDGDAARVAGVRARVLVRDAPDCLASVDACAKTPPRPRAFMPSTRRHSSPDTPSMP